MKTVWDGDQVVMVTDDDPRATGDAIGASLQKMGIYQSPEGWAIVTGSPGGQLGGAPRIILDTNGKQPPPDVLSRFPMASPQEQQGVARQKAQYEAGEGKPTSMGEAVLAAVASYFGASALGGMAGGAAGAGAEAGGAGAFDAGGSAGVFDSAGNPLYQGGANAIGDFNPTYTAGPSGFEEPSSLSVTDVPAEGAVDGVQAGVDAANSVSPYTLNGTAGAQTVAGATGAASSPFSWLTAANSLPILGAAGSVGSALIGAGAAKSAANQISNAANNATANQQATQAQITANNAPFLQTGTAALKDIGAGAGLDGYTPSANSGITPGQFTHTFDANDLKTNLAPNYQFQLDQGLGAVKNAGNLQTGLLSGNTLKGINDYAQNFAGNSYQQAFNNYNAGQTNIFNRLSTIAGLGTTANQTTGQTSAQISGNVANTTVGAAQAAGSGTVGAANAIGSGVNNAVSWYALNNLLKPTGTGGGQTYDNYGV